MLKIALAKEIIYKEGKMPGESRTLTTEYGSKKRKIVFLDRFKRIVKTLWAWWIGSSQHSESLLYRPISYVPFIPPPATLVQKKPQERGPAWEEEAVRIEDLKIIYKKTEEVIERKIGSTIILVPLRPIDPQNPYILSLEGIGESIWQLIDGKRSVGQILEILSKEFAVKRTQLLTDLLEFLDQLKAVGGITE